MPTDSDEMSLGHRWKQYGDQMQCAMCSVMVQRVYVEAMGRAIRLYWVEGMWTPNRPQCGIH